MIVCSQNALRNTIIRANTQASRRFFAVPPPRKKTSAVVQNSAAEPKKENVKTENPYFAKLEELMCDSKEDSSRSVVFSSVDTDKFSSKTTPSRTISPISYLKIPKEELDRIDLEQRIGYIRGFRAQIHGQYGKSKGTGTVIMGAGACSDQHQRTKLGRFHHKGHLECVYGKRGKVGMKMNMDFDIAKIVDTAYIHYKEEDKVATSRRKNPRRYPIRHQLGSPAQDFWRKLTPFSERQ